MQAMIREKLNGITNSICRYAGRKAARVNLDLNSLIAKPELIFYKILRSFLIMFVLFFFLVLTPILLGTDYESMLNVAEFGVIGSGTLAILTFTYAIAKQNDNCDKIIKSGELLLKSTVTLILGIGLFPLMSYAVRNPKDVGGLLGIFAGAYDVVVAVGLLFLLFVGIVSLLVSGVFFITGIKELIEVFETDSTNSRN